jgi:hypothetical protein
MKFWLGFLISNCRACFWDQAIVPGNVREVESADNFLDEPVKILEHCVA